MIKLLKNGKQIDYATLPYVPLSFQFDDTQQVKDKLLNDVLCDREFLWKDLQMRKIMDILGLGKICLMKEKDNYHLGN